MDNAWLGCRLFLDDGFGQERWLTTWVLSRPVLDEGEYEVEPMAPVILENILQRTLHDGGLRRFAENTDIDPCAMLPPRLPDRELLRVVLGKFEDGRLVVLRRASKGRGSRTGKVSLDAVRTARDVERLSHGKLVCGSRTYTLVAQGQFDRSVLGLTRQIVPPKEGLDLLEKMVPLHAAKPELAKLIGEAFQLLSTATREIDQEPELLLLRHLARPKPRATDNEPAMTPSQLLAAMSATLDITLVDLDGTPQEGVVFEIKGPDGSVTKGKLDENGAGYARSSCNGVFAVSFPELDGADWDGDGVLELPSEAKRTEVKRHPVAQGERMTTIARQYRFENWQTIWDFHGNEKLRDLRTNPQVLMPGDEVSIPSRIAGRAEVAAGSAKYTVRSSAETLSVQFDEANVGDEDAKVRFRARPDKGEAIEGNLNGGTMKISVPTGARTIEVDLFVGGDEESFACYQLALGHIDPHDEISGIQARLANRGYYAGPISGEMDEPTRQAIADFRLVTMGDSLDTIDDSFLAALHDEHGS